MKNFKARFEEAIQETGKFYDTNNLFLRVYKPESKYQIEIIGL
tara:strand:- start:115 stop:243 length:129 start_codon:yes stop_codon:yes gene_type:complete